MKPIVVPDTPAGLAFLETFSRIADRIDRMDAAAEQVLREAQDAQRNGLGGHNPEPGQTTKVGDFDNQHFAA